MTIFVAWQLRVTLDSIRNSCDVWLIFGSLTSSTGWACLVPTPSWWWLRGRCWPLWRRRRPAGSPRWSTGRLSAWKRRSLLKMSIWPTLRTIPPQKLLTNPGLVTSIYQTPFSRRLNNFFRCLSFNSINKSFPPSCIALWSTELETIFVALDNRYPIHLQSYWEL